MPTLKTHITNVVSTNLRLFLFFNAKDTKNIEKKEKFFIKPPAINSSPKNQNYETLNF